MNAKAEVTDGDRLGETVQHVLALSDTQEAAVEMLLREVAKDTALREALLAPWEREAAKHAISGAIRSERRAIWSRPAGPDARVGALANAVRRSLLDFRLPGGLPLRLATAAEIAEAAETYRKRAEDEAGKSRWLRRVEAALPDGKRVGDVMDDAALEKLRAEDDA